MRTINVYAHNKCECMRVCVCVRNCVYVNASVNKTSWKHLRMNIFSKCQVFFFCTWRQLRVAHCAQTAKAAAAAAGYALVGDTYTYIHTFMCLLRRCVCVYVNMWNVRLTVCQSIVLPAAALVVVVTVCLAFHQRHRRCRCLYLYLYLCLCRHRRQVRKIKTKRCQTKSRHQRH